MLQDIGTVAADAIGDLMDSPLPYGKSLVAKPVIRLPTCPADARALKLWADAQPDGHPAAEIKELTTHLDFLAATLPRQATDVESGRKRVAVYARMLGGFSNDALAFMARTACETLDWFPTPHQCLAILEAYRPPLTEKEQALMLCRTFWQERLELWLDALTTDAMVQDDIDAAPEQWRRIAVEHGKMRRLDDGSYVMRRGHSADERYRRDLSP